MITSTRCALPSLTAVSKSISVVRTPAEVGLPAPVAAGTDSKDTFSRHLCLDHLGDFGCAAEANKVGVVQNLYVRAHGSRVWFPPENQHPNLYDERDVSYYGRKTDIWQVGGIIQCMMAMRNYSKQEVINSPITGTSSQ